MEKAVDGLFNDFISSYTGRDKSVDFSDWLAERLKQEMPDTENEASQRLSEEIIEAVGAYDQTLAELDEAIESGQSKEEWLAGSIAETYAGMPYDSAGNSLQKVCDDLYMSNAALMGETEDIPEPVTTNEGTEIVEWNEYGVKFKALEVGKQAIMSGLGVAADTIKRNRESGEVVDAGVIGQALQEGLQTSKSEVKAVVAGAIKSAAEKRLTDALPEDTPTETICDMACVAVESADALLGVATGKTTVTEALDKVGRSSVVAVCRSGAKVLEGTLKAIPYVGPLVAEFAGGLLEHMSGSKFAENVYTVVKDAAVATWEGIKQTGSKFLNKLTNIFTERQYN
jgi:hypothetical protein